MIGLIATCETLFHEFYRWNYFILRGELLAHSVQQVKCWGFLFGFGF